MGNQINLLVYCPLKLQWKIYSDKESKKIFPFQISQNYLQFPYTKPMAMLHCSMKMQKLCVSWELPISAEHLNSIHLYRKSVM